MDSVKFSIIIPIYNVESYLKKCIDSVLSQSFIDFEIIAVNDGSKDNSLSILKSISDSRLKVFSKENGGLSSARNFGLEHASGDYIWFLDGDDYIEPNSLEILNNVVSSTNSDIVCFGFYNDYQSYKEKAVDRITWGIEELYPLITVSACTKIYKREFFLKNNFLFKKGVLFEDLEIIPDVMTSTNKISFIEDYLYNYVQRNGSIIRNNNVFKENRDDRFIVLDSLFNRFKEKCKYDKYKEQLNYLAIRHLVNIYSEELFSYDKDIYYSRFFKINSYLDELKADQNNKYLKQSPLSGKIYFYFFRKKMYFVCKMFIKVKKLLKRK